jgi:hypothetical protein
MGSITSHPEAVRRLSAGSVEPPSPSCRIAQQVGGGTAGTSSLLCWVYLHATTVLFVTPPSVNRSRCHSVGHCAINYRMIDTTFTRLPAPRLPRCRKGATARAGSLAAQASLDPLTGIFIFDGPNSSSAVARQADAPVQGGPSSAPPDPWSSSKGAFAIGAPSPRQDRLHTRSGDRGEITSGREPTNAYNARLAPLPLALESG